MLDIVLTLIHVIAAIGVLVSVAQIVWMEKVTEAGGFSCGTVLGMIAALLVFIYAPLHIAIILAIGTALTYWGLQQLIYHTILKPHLQEEHTRRLEAAHLIRDAAGKRQILVPRGYAYPTETDSSLKAPVLIIDFDTRLQNLAQSAGIIRNVQAEYRLFPFNNSMLYHASPCFSLFMFVTFDIEQQGYVIPLCIAESHSAQSAEDMRLDHIGSPILRLIKVVNRLKLAPYDPATYERKWECYGKYSYPERERQLASLYEATVAKMPSVQLEWSGFSVKYVMAGDKWKVRSDEEKYLMKSPFTHYRTPAAHLKFRYITWYGIIGIYFAALLQNGISLDSNAYESMTDLPPLAY